MLAISRFEKGRRESRRYRQTGKNGIRVGVAYTDYDRPFEKGDIMGDFAWRRTHVAPFPTKLVKNIIAGYMKAYGFEPTHVAYSRYAGCSCPCSPGYIIYGRRISPYRWGKKTKFNFDPQYDEFHISLAPPAKIREGRKMMAEAKLAREQEKIKAIQGAGI